MSEQVCVEMLTAGGNFHTYLLCLCYQELEHLETSFSSDNLYCWNKHNESVHANSPPYALINVSMFWTTVFIIRVYNLYTFSLACSLFQVYFLCVFQVQELGREIMKVDNGWPSVNLADNCDGKARIVPRWVLALMRWTNKKQHLQAWNELILSLHTFPHLLLDCRGLLD